MVIFVWILNLYTLLPRKSNSFIPEVAKEFEVSENTVQDIVDIYWKEIRKALTETKFPRVVVAKFGSFRIKESLVEETLNMHKTFLENNNPENMTFLKHQWKVEIEKRLENLLKLVEVIKEDKVKKKEVKSKKQSNESHKNLEE
jgi:nucleoid DNA-binding protein